MPQMYHLHYYPNLGPDMPVVAWGGVGGGGMQITEI